VKKLRIECYIILYINVLYLGIFKLFMIIIIIRILLFMFYFRFGSRNRTSLKWIHDDIEWRVQGGRAITIKDPRDKQKQKGLHLIRIPCFESGPLNTVRSDCTLDPSTLLGFLFLNVISRRIKVTLLLFNKLRSRHGFLKNNKCPR